MAFMERHPVIAKNYYKGDKLASEAAWKRLSKELNSVGPPVKEAGEWKRVGPARIGSLSNDSLRATLSGMEGLEELHTEKDSQQQAGAKCNGKEFFVSGYTDAVGGCCCNDLRSV